MKFIVMCGGKYPHEVPRQLWILKDNERILERTIRLLAEAGIPKNDTFISYSDPVFQAVAEKAGVGLIHQNETEFTRWIDGAFPVLTEPVCYIFGDVIFSPAAIRTIIDTETKDIEFFASAAPYHKRYIKTWAEPFCFKVQNFQHFSGAIKRTRELYDIRILDRCISWELWQVIKETLPNNIIVNYTVIRDYTCDVDNQAELEKMRAIITEAEDEERELIQTVGI